MYVLEVLMTCFYIIVQTFIVLLTYFKILNKCIFPLATRDLSYAFPQTAHIMAFETPVMETQSGREKTNDFKPMT